MATTTLAGTTVLVTGAAGGLGKAIAKGYLEAGANVAICDINAERLSQTSAEFEATGRFLGAKTDVTDEEAVVALVDSVVARFGRLDVLVNNAGMADTFQPAGTLSKTAWDRVLSLNLTGSFLPTKAAVNAMEKQEPAGGVIIQIGSTASSRGLESGLAYTVSKHGAAALVKNTAGYYGPKGIYAIGLMLGAMIDTNISESMKGLGEAWNMEAFQRTTAATLAANPEEMAGAAIRLVDVAKYCIFLSDRSIAASANGSCITFNKNSPRA
ncbi:putative short chain dehydrogenase protein [Eutypa lata UCREL1]|uniref:Putative short chain dehydrogenase protein n=1 Tax=Eutypa lata (strain UCR-EL1) TaxID=1287681 RepID=M7TBR6_EUTLA|nr:putative short chain dehydrogenase protein [Eutypa lata UCREL1]